MTYIQIVFKSQRVQRNDVHSKVENTYNSEHCGFISWAIQNAGLKITQTKQGEKDDLFQHIHHGELISAMSEKWAIINVFGNDSLS